MNKLFISTKNFEPNTKLSQKQLIKLEEKLENLVPNREIILEIAIIIRDNTLSHLTENELDRMIFMLKEKKGSLREIQSIVLRAIMMAIPFSNGGKRIKRHTIKKRKIHKRYRYTKRK